VSRANYTIVRETGTEVVIKDLGPWDKHPTVTNDAENVVKELAPLLNGRKLHYIDSDGDVDELIVKDGRFAGFAPVGTRSDISTGYIRLANGRDASLTEAGWEVWPWRSDKEPFVFDSIGEVKEWGRTHDAFGRKL